MINAGEDTENMEFLYMVSRFEKWFRDVGNALTVSSKVKHILALWSNNPTPWCLPKSNGNLHMQMLMVATQCPSAGKYASCIMKY